MYSALGRWDAHRILGTTHAGWTGGERVRLVAVFVVRGVRHESVRIWARPRLRAREKKDLNSVASKREAPKDEKVVEEMQEATGTIRLRGSRGLGQRLPTRNGEKSKVWLTEGRSDKNAAFLVP